MRAVDQPSQSASGPAAGPWREPVFLTTHWSVVLSAGRSDTTRAHAALEKLCGTYWFPVYAHIRRRGYSPEDAQDLAQECFVRLLASRSLAHADPERGRFRSFLLGVVNHCLADHQAQVRAQKRGGGRAVLSLDLAAAEERFDLEPADRDTPDQAFDRRWAAALLDQVLRRLEDEYAREHKSALFSALRPTLVGTRESQPYAELAAGLGVSEGAVRTAVHRLRQRYRELIRDEIAGTVGSPDAVNEELRYLFKMSGGR